MGVFVRVFAYVFYGVLLRTTAEGIFFKILGHRSCLGGTYVKIKGGGFASG
jgi:hypothetical protein